MRILDSLPDAYGAGMDAGLSCFAAAASRAGARSREARSGVQLGGFPTRRLVDRSTVTSINRSLNAMSRSHSQGEE
jgi:hypothetical protein